MRIPIQDAIFQVVANACEWERVVCESWIVAESHLGGMGVVCAKDKQMAMKYFGDLKTGRVFKTSGELHDQKALVGCLIHKSDGSDAAKCLGEIFSRLFRHQIEAGSDMASFALFAPTLRAKLLRFNLRTRKSLSCSTWTQRYKPF